MRDASLFNNARGVIIGVGGVAATQALERRLRRSVAFFSVAALRTFLAGIVRFHPHHQLAPVVQFVRGELANLAHVDRVQGSVEATLSAGPVGQPTSGVFTEFRFGFAHHVADFEVFKGRDERGVIRDFLGNVVRIVVLNLGLFSLYRPILHCIFFSPPVRFRFTVPAVRSLARAIRAYFR